MSVSEAVAVEDSLGDLVIEEGKEEAVEIVGEEETADNEEKEAVEKEEETQEMTIPMVQSFPDNKPCGVVVHKEKAYNEVVDRSVPLDYLGEGMENAEEVDRIVFEHTTGVHVDSVVNLSSSGDFVQTNPFPLCYDGVLWGYALRITRVKERKNALALVCIGPHLGLDSSTKKGSMGENTPRDLGTPRILKAELLVTEGSEETAKEGEKGAEEEIVKVELIPNRDGTLLASRTFSSEEIVKMAGGPTTKVLNMVARIVAEKEFFRLRRIIDLDKNDASQMAGNARDVLATILKGERPPGWDWVITVGKHEPGEPSEYFVHKAAFAVASDGFRVVMATGHSWKENILHVTGENRCIFPALSAEDMKVVIPLVYALYSPLPSWQSISSLGRSLCVLMKRDLILSAVFPQWERALVREALALDRSSPLSTARECVRLLTMVWSCPYGALPVAKRAIVAVFADTIHRSGEDEQEFVLRQLIPTLGELQTVHLQPILHSVSMHLTCVRAVKKTGLKKAADVAWD